MSEPVIVMPYRETDEHRARAYTYVTDRLADAGFPTILVGDCLDPLWCKSDAVAHAVRDWDADILIVHDADVLVDLDELRAAVGHVEHGCCAWAIPHQDVHRYDQQTTGRLYDGTLTAADTFLTRHPYLGMEGGGVTVVRRDVWDDCPIDRRFRGWGSEDQAWGWALACLHGRPWRSESPLVHLWHPHAAPAHVQRSPRSESELLLRAYRAYRDFPAQMRRLVDDARLVTR